MTKDQGGAERMEEFNKKPEGGGLMTDLGGARGHRGPEELVGV